MESLVVAIAMKVAGRPVKLRLTREEEFYTAFVRQGLTAYFKMGCDKDGKLLAMENKFYWDSGAYTEYAVNMTRASVTAPVVHTMSQCEDRQLLCLHQPPVTGRCAVLAC